MFLPPRCLNGDLVPYAGRQQCVVSLMADPRCEMLEQHFTRPTVDVCRVFLHILNPSFALTYDSRNSPKCRLFAITA
jgi:hypothetical protein